MSVVVDCLASSGSLLAAAGSAFRVKEELGQYHTLLQELGIDQVRASLREYVGRFLQLMATVSMIPRGPTGRPRPIFKAMVQDTLDAQAAEANRAGAALLADARAVRLKARHEKALPLKRKAVYWFLILVASVLLLSASLVALGDC